MYDVVVIGAGPSGSMSSMELAAAGYKVLLIEKKKIIGEPVQCGEGISEYAFKHVDLPITSEWLKKKTKGVKSILPNNTFFYSTCPTLTIDRKKFDQWLANKAVEKGAILKKETKLQKINKKPDGWDIQTDNGDYKTRVVVGADGPMSKTARELNLVTKSFYYRAFQYKFDADQTGFHEDTWLCMYWDAKYKGGYGWVFPRGDQYNVGVGGPEINVSHLKQFCKRTGFDAEKRLITNAGLVPIMIKFKKRAGKGFAIVGDAAGMTNPVTGGGIHGALYSGKLAGEIISEALKEENPGKIGEYDKKISNSIFLNPIHIKTFNYLKKWNNEKWNYFGKAVHGREMSKPNLLEKLSIGLKNPRLLLHTREMLIISKDMEINQKCI